MSRPNSVPGELLPWDTGFFGCRIARVSGDTLKPEQAVQIDEWCHRSRVRGLYFLSRADDPATIQTAEKNDFELVDIRITFERGVMDLPDSNRPVLPGGAHIRPFQAADLSGLQAMARTGHRGTRFYTDPHFPRQRVEDLYSTWITLESEGRAQIVLVGVSPDNLPLGYVSCHLDPGHREGQIGLVGVRPEVRGRGVGKNLVLAAMDWFRAQGAQEATVVTQGNNRPAQRLYQQCGFLSRDLQLWYHKWYPVLD
jgi:dTDP-4-amino-4,6-dideoxy-D-galactose acyltransferase